ncbi:hypothetical protein LXA43DRAFT_1067687 [Ganoderma leucocontextum]|nr:hypothetical protein LXA43DRAFT_1067687 [Ganoderma leucocontextum]
MLLHRPPSPTQLMGNQHSSRSEPDKPSAPTDGTPPAKSLPPVPPCETSTEPDKPSAQCLPRSRWFHLKIWTETGKTYIPVSVLVAHPQLRLLPGFADLPPTKTLQFWGQEDGIWVDSTPDLLPFHIHQSARSVLVRYPSAVNCVGFPQALRLLDEERGVDPGPNEWDYVDLRSQYPRHDHGEELTVVAYAEDDKQPTLFYVTLTKDGLVRWDLHPQLLAHVMGSSRGDYQAVFCSWNAISHSWDFVEPSEPFKPCDRHDLAVIRHKANSSPEGLPHFFAELDAQTQRPVLCLLVAPLFTNRRPAGSEPLTMKGRTKNLWPTLVSTHARIPPRVTSLSASISSVLTSARPTTARTYASISSLQPLKSTDICEHDYDLHVCKHLRCAALEDHKIARISSQPQHDLDLRPAEVNTHSQHPEGSSKPEFHPVLGRRLHSSPAQEIQNNGSIRSHFRGLQTN